MDNRKEILSFSNFNLLQKNYFELSIKKDVCIHQISLEGLSLKIFNKNKKYIILEAMIHKINLHSIVILNDTIILKKILDLRENKNGDFFNQFYIFNDKIYFSIPNLFDTTPTMDQIKNFLRTKKYKILTISENCF